MQVTGELKSGKGEKKNGENLSFNIGTNYSKLVKQLKQPAVNFLNNHL
jgi:hypothetical protein